MSNLPSSQSNVFVTNIFSEFFKLCDVFKVVILEMWHADVTITNRAKHRVVFGVVVLSFDVMSDTVQVTMLTPRHGILTVGG